MVPRTYAPSVCSMANSCRNWFQRGMPPYRSFNELLSMDNLWSDHFPKDLASFGRHVSACLLVRCFVHYKVPIAIIDMAIHRELGFTF